MDTSAATANEAQVIEASHLVLDGGGGVAQLGRVVLVVPRHHRHQGAVGNVAEGHHLVAQHTGGVRGGGKVWLASSSLQFATVCAADVACQRQH